MTKNRSDFTNIFAAQILESGASAYAGAAAAHLLNHHPEVSERYSPSPMKLWSAHLKQRLLELSAALASHEAVLFTSRVRWELKALQVRGKVEADLRHALESLRHILDQELPTAPKQAALHFLDLGLATLDEPIADEPTLDPDLPVHRLALTYLKAALEGNCDNACRMASREVQNNPDLRLSDGYHALLLAQREVGRLWHRGEMEIAEEHLVTNTTERAITILYQSAERKPRNGKTLVVAAVAGNQHGLVVRVLADLFEIDGWRTICLGADVPPNQFAVAVEYFEAELVAISVALPTQLKAARATIRELKALDSVPKILVGGSAFEDTPDLWEALGADGSILDLDGAVRLAGELAAVS